MFKRLYTSVVTPFQEALEEWDNRKEKSVKALGSTPLYDRYDPACGLHAEPKHD